ncbi:type VII secretion protein EccCa [Dactylosporangium sp. CA-092794]|uniref:type VII secretion protein EccCa n=1 Tax=Dactylosporangium sp. CA-092794 TaxID=3239929 RepID=UPI003D8DAA9F
MATVVIKRLPRRPAPEYPSGEVVLQSPPEVSVPDGARWQQVLMMLPMLAGSMAMALMYSSYAATGRSNVLMYVTGGLFGLSSVGMLGSQFMFAGGQSKRQMRAARREYVRYLSQLRIRVRRTVLLQRESLHYHYPGPDTLWSVPASQRLWERRPADPDFGMVRIGLGPQELATPLIPPQTKPLDQLEPMCAAALRRFITAYAIVDDLPVAMALDGFARVHLRGDAARCAALVRAVLAQVTMFHAPEDLLVAVCAGPDRRASWEWVKWLPHALHPSRTDALGQVRLVSETVTGLEAMLDDVIASRPRFNPSESSQRVGRVGRHLVVVLDGGSTAGSDHLMTDGGMEGVTILDLSSPVPRMLDYATLVLDITAEGTLSSTTISATSEMGRADALSLSAVQLLSRQLTPLRLSAAARPELAMNSEIGLAQLLRIDDPFELDTAVTWQVRPNRDRLRVPIGVSADGTPVELDLKESAQDGMGPHGLLIGATGSGKSELLRTLVLALAATHDSETLNFVLVDFKGGATFTKLDRLPHTSAVITNLVDELPLVDRMTEAINGELVRRQELLRATGNYVSQRDYEKARAAGAPLAPLPSLLVICDEFSELLSARPDFIEMFLQIGRVGRSLGVHLLLASQRLEEGRLRGLDTHLSYRIGLRTFSAGESRVVLGVTDAYELPRSPGHGYMKYGTEVMTRFRAAYVSGVLRRDGVPTTAAAADAQVRDYATQYVTPVLADEPAERDEPDDESMGESLLDVLVGRIEDRGVPAHQVWLPPLGEPPSLDGLLPPLRATSDRGLTVDDPARHGRLQAAVGAIDRPFEQRRDVLWLDLSGGGGHAVVVGGPRSGKSNVLRAIITSLALTHTPSEVQFYCLDFGGGTLSTLLELPHVGGVATRLEIGQVRRTVAEISLLIAQRERQFTQRRIDSMATYRRLRREGALSDDPFGDVFLVVDGWSTVRSEYEDLEPRFNEIAGRGLTFGVHLLVTAGRWMELRPAVRDMLTTRLELRLGDPSDSMLNRHAAMNIPEQSPGRGITPDLHHFLAALPRLDGAHTVEDLTEGVAKLVAGVAGAWQGPAAPPVRLLPPMYAYDEMPIDDPRSGLPIGIAELDLGPVFVDLATDPHFLLYGDIGSGKSAFLRAFARTITERFTPDEARILIVDYRRSLLGAVATDHLIGYGTSAPRAVEMLAEVAQVMQGRLPGPDVTAEQLRNRTWWYGPELYVLVDDYDLVAGSQSNPLQHLLEYFGQARDVGLHVILARRSGGAGRSLYEPVMMTIRELGSAGIVMSGSKDEGALLGNVRPAPMPPGRGWLVTRRGGAQLVQLAWLDPPE